VTRLAELQSAQVGLTDVRVTHLGLGGGALGGFFETVSEDAAVGAVERAYELGVRYFDTAPLYGHGRSEERLGRALAGIKRDDFVLSTKVGVRIDPRRAGAPEIEARYADPFLLDGGYDFSYDGCLRSLEASMGRVGTDRIDIVYIHDPDEADSALPLSLRSGADHFGEAMDGAYRALDELRAQGVIGAVGVGLNGTEMLVRFAGAGSFDCFLLAGRYTLLQQNGLDDLLPLCVDQGISIVVGGVFNSGILATGTGAAAPKYDYREADPGTLARVRRIEALCGEHGISLTAAALQFPLAHEAVVSVIPGVRDAVEVEQDVDGAVAPIPVEFWSALADRGLVDRRAVERRLMPPAAGHSRPSMHATTAEEG